MPEVDPVYLVNGDDLFDVEVLLDAARNEINSPATDTIIDAMSALVRALKPIACPTTPMHGIAHVKDK